MSIYRDFRTGEWVMPISSLSFGQESSMKGLTVAGAASELGKSPRTIFRMIKDGRLKAEKYELPYGKDKFVWLIDTMSIARIQVRKEMKLEQKQKKQSKQHKK